MQVISLSERSNEIVNFIEENEVYIPDEIQNQLLEFMKKMFRPKKIFCQ